jgi:hypothetical protein
MSRGRGRGRVAITLLAGVLALLGIALAPVRAGAVDSDLKHAFAFEVEASNGYSILAYAVNERADGRGEVVLIVSRKQAFAVYVAPAQLTATTVEADLGVLGGISLEVIPTGREKRSRLRCDELRTVAFEPQRYRGSFEFHGEEGYAEAATDAPREHTRLFFEEGCRTYDYPQVGGDDIQGAGLRLHSRRRGLGFDLTARKNGPSKRVRLQVGVEEERAGISISRGISRWAGAGAFGYDPLLRRAVLAPPVPFSGSASFHRNAAARDRWSGNLTVDLPGRSNVPLTGPKVKATLVDK